MEGSYYKCHSTGQKFVCPCPVKLFKEMKNVEDKEFDIIMSSKSKIVREILI